jgi:hypothetical protein
LVFFEERSRSEDDIHDHIVISICHAIFDINRAYCRVDQDASLLRGRGEQCGVLSATDRKRETAAL